MDLFRVPPGLPASLALACPSPSVSSPSVSPVLFSDVFRCDLPLLERSEFLFWPLLTSLELPRDSRGGFIGRPSALASPCPFSSPSLSSLFPSCVFLVSCLCVPPSFPSSLVTGRASPCWRSPNAPQARPQSLVSPSCPCPCPCSSPCPCLCPCPCLSLCPCLCPCSSPCPCPCSSPCPCPCPCSCVGLCSCSLLCRSLCSSSCSGSCSCACVALLVFVLVASCFQILLLSRVSVCRVRPRRLLPHAEAADTAVVVRADWSARKV